MSVRVRRHSRRSRSLADYVRRAPRNTESRLAYVRAALVQLRDREEFDTHNAYKEYVHATPSRRRMTVREFTQTLTHHQTDLGIELIRLEDRTAGEGTVKWRWNQ